MTRIAKGILIIIILLIVGVVIFLVRPKTPAPAASATNTASMTVTTTTEVIGSDVSSEPPATTPPANNSGAPMIRAYGSVTLKVDQQAKFTDAVVTPTSVEESRCPKNVLCIQAGTARVHFSVAGASGSTAKTLAIGESAVAEGVKISLISVTPYPVAGKTIGQSDYAITFSVTKPVVQASCYIGGCSNELCTDNPNAVSSCIYRASYACYKDAICERQVTGECGWTEDPSLRACLANASSSSAVQ